MSNWTKSVILMLILQTGKLPTASTQLRSDTSRQVLTKVLQSKINLFVSALLFLLSSTSERKMSLKELLFIIQSAPELREDKLIPYLWTHDNSGTQAKLRTYLMARFLMPELFSYGPSVSVAIALLSS